jgi:imidazolonepropionase-like amidohydrolase
MIKCALFVAFLSGLAFYLFTPSQSAERPGDLRPRVFAIRDARVVPEPGKVLAKATVVIRDGLIEAVGPEVNVPADALVMDGKGLTVYAGFLDAMSNWGFDPALRRSEIGAPAPEDFAAEVLAATKPDNRKGMTPEFAVSTALRDEEQADAWRRAGFTAHLIAPDGGFFVGQSALVSLSGLAPREAVLRSPVALHSSFRPVAGSDYPRALMGIIAHCRQTLLDAGHYQRVWAAYEKAGRIGKRPPFDPSLADLGPALDGKMPVVFEADTKDAIHRSLDFAAELKMRPILYGAGQAWKAVERLKQEQVPVLVRLNFDEQQRQRSGRRPGLPVPPATPMPPTTPRRPAAPEQPAPSPEVETNVPERLKNERDRLAKEERHNLAVLHQNGVLFAISTQGQTGDKPADKFRENLRKAIAEGLPADAALKALTIDAARILGVDKQLGTVEKGKAAHLIVTDGDFHEEKTQVRYVFADGVRFVYDSPARPDAKPGEAKQADEKKKDDTKKADANKPQETKKAEYAVEIEADRKPKIKTGRNVLIKGATILTVTNGTHPKTDLLVRDGKIAKIGANLELPSGVTVLDAQGLFVTPGIIDTHCHFAISGGVNEFSLSVVPEVRVRDVIDSDDVQIYRALAGGVTTARLLHGSANVIGGQDAVIKLKFCDPASKLLIADAPRGVKFALGENVKRTDGRFPNSRLGVEAVLVRAFTEAREYRKMWEEYEKSKASGGRQLPDDSNQSGGLRPPLAEPRRDLRLEALSDVLKGDLKVHCHCYRADEILMLLRVADRFGFKIKSLQHVLEGYKIAPEIADHGASCSSFADWWAYKIEAFDAIPFNAALLHEAGAQVCLKSDSNELMRHLYQEAAKCIKYGGMSETDALKTITLNGAKQLGLEGRTGSIEVGKDADLAIFDGHPLNSYSRVDMTLVEGEVYFQRSDRPSPAPAAASAPAAKANDVPAIRRNEDGTYILGDVTVHPANGPVVEHASVVIAKGKINSIDTSAIHNIPGATFINAKGMHVYPGMIDAATVIGLTELGSARETHDYSEGGDFQPDLRASIAINADSELIPVTRANGVLTVLTRPTGSIIAGQSALINLAGWVPKEMAIVDPVALHVDFPTVTPMFSGDPNAPAVGRIIARKQREEKLRRLKELFQQALAHDEARKQSAYHGANPRLEALIPYTRGQRPVVIQANRRDDILEALKLADELKLKMILSGGIEAWKIADELKKRDVPVILGPTMVLPQETFDLYDAPFACAARLHEAGVKFCIRSGGSMNTRNLPYEAAMAVSYGLPPEEGLKAVTVYPAQILGVADQLGSIETGKRANLVLTNGDILQASTQVLALFIDGKPLEPTSKHTRLYERYRERLREVKEGKAPLGTK